MTVNLTRIYTKLGDDGETHLGDMSRVSKLHPRVEAYGTVDELNATIGVALLAPRLPERFAEWLARVQNDLLDIGADLSVPALAADPSASAAPADESADASARERLRVGPDYTLWLERALDEVNATLEPLRSFVIPGGSPAAAHLHVCRTVCRRAERRTIAVGPEAFDVEVDSLANELFGCLVGWASYAETRKVWDVGAPAGGGLLKDDGVLFHGFIPACLKILLRVPSSISSEGCPAMVTLPGLVGCLNWRWLPR